MSRIFCITVSSSLGGTLTGLDPGVIEADDLLGNWFEPVNEKGHQPLH